MGDQAITTETLRETLFQTIQGVIDGSVPPKEAAQVANLADKMIKTGDLEIRYTEHCTKMDKDENGLPPGPMMLGNSTKSLPGGKS